MALEHVTDHQLQALGRLAEQYKSSVSVSGLVKAATAEHQALEDVLWAEFTLTVDTATGALLDQFGRLVGQARAGRDDPTYRTWIKARQLVNRSGGTGPDLIAIFLALAPAGATVQLRQEPPKGLVISLGAVATTNYADLAAVLRAAADA